nr:succinoglycan biosynthesis protein exop [Rhizobium sp. Khangiran2]
MLADRPNHGLIEVDALASAAPSRLLRGIVTILLAAVVGAVISLPLAMWSPRQVSVDAALKIEGGALTASMAASLSNALSSGAHEPVHPEAERQNEVDAANSSLSGMILDALLGAPPVTHGDEAAAEVAAGSVRLVPAEEGRMLLVRATTSDAATATRAANSVAAELVDNQAVWLPVAPDQKLSELEAAAEEAKTNLEAFKAGLDSKELAAAERAGGAEQSSQREVSKLEARIMQLSEQVQEAALMTSADVLKQSLPDRLEYTALEYHRQRYVDAKLAFDKLSRQLGPRHPNLLGAKGALDAAKADIDRELVKLVNGLEAQKADASQKLDELKRREPAISSESQALRQQLDSLEAAARTSEELYREASSVAQTGNAASPLSLTLIAQAEPERAVATGWTLPGAIATGAVAGMSIALMFLQWRRRSRTVSRTVSEAVRDGLRCDPDVQEMNDPLSDHGEGVEDGLALSPSMDDAPLAERIRQILYQNAVPADRAPSFPPLVASAIAGQLHHTLCHELSPGDLPRPANDEDPLERELWELHHQLAELRGRVVRRSARGR